MNECKFKASVVSTTDKKRDWGPSVEILMLTPEPKGEFSFFPPSFLTGHEGNMGEIERSMKKRKYVGKNNDEDNYCTPFCGNSQGEKVL